MWNSHQSTTDDLAEEMRQHIQEKTQALEDAGIDPEEAQVQARRSFGNQALLQDRSVEIWQERLIRPIASDFKYGWRQLKRAPAFSIVAVLILAIGIGANTAVFTLLYAITARDLPVYRPAELGSIEIGNPKLGSSTMGISYPMFEQLRHRQQSFTGLAAWTMANASILDPYGALRSVIISPVTGNFFDQLGVRPALGRLLTDSDDVPRGLNDPWPIVLSYSFWKENFHADRSILGKTITVSQSPAIVVGVAASSFEGLELGLPTRAFLPMHFLVDHDDEGKLAIALTDPSNFRFLTFGRLRPGISLPEANDEISGYTAPVLLPAVPKNVPPSPFLRNAMLQVATARYGISRLKSYGGPLTSLQAIMAIVLFLCCFNVMGLQLARVSARRHEFAVRLALGAGRSHLVRQSLAEASLLATSGATLAAPFSWCSINLLSTFLTGPGWATTTHLRPDWSVFAIAGAIAVVTTLVVGILPALVAGRTAPGAVLRAKASLQRTPIKVGRVLVPLQIALSFLLVVVTGLLLTTLLQLRREDTGYDVRHVVEVSAQFQWLKESPEAIMDRYRLMVLQLRAEPGIENAGITWITPMTGFKPQAQGRVASTAEQHNMDFNQVGPGYFGTLGISLISGRDFTDDDRNQHICIINRSAAQMFYGSRSALDGELQITYHRDITNVLCRIVGVVQDTKYADLRSPEGPALYLPITAESVALGGYRNNMVFLMRSEDDKSVVAAYRRVLANFAPTIPYSIFLPLREQKDQALGSERLMTLMSVLFGGVALPLCGIGMFGLLAMRVEQRTTEIALRLALGASRARVLRQVLREGLSLLVKGLLLGVPALLLAAAAGLAAADALFHVPAFDFVTNFSQHFLYETSPLDLYNITGALLLLLVVSLIATFLPAWRAAHLDPLTMLRRE